MSAVPPSRSEAAASEPARVDPVVELYPPIMSAGELLLRALIVIAGAIIGLILAVIVGDHYHWLPFIC